MTLLSLVGLLGGVCFAYCGVPTAWRTARSGRSIGTPVSVAWMIFLGGILMYYYLTAAHGFDPILAVNYGVEIASWAVVVWFHYRPRVRETPQADTPAPAAPHRASAGARHPSPAPGGRAAIAFAEESAKKEPRP